MTSFSRSTAFHRVWPELEPIDRRHLTAIAEATPKSMLGHCINTVIAVIALIGVGDDRLILAWGLFSLAIAAFVFARSVRRSRATSQARSTPSRRAAWRAVTFAIALAAPWSILSAASIGSIDGPAALIVVCLAVGMAASGSVMLSPIRPAAIAYMLTVLLPTAVKCLIALGDTGSALLGCLTLSYCLFLMTLINTAHKLFHERLDAVEKLGHSLARIQEEHHRTEHAATHDPLTDLSNRRVVTEKLEALENSREPQYALLFLDLDRFKLVNDNFGHQFGDELLQQVARRMTASVRPVDTVARRGGDEFAVIVEGIISVDEVCRIADRLVAAIAEPYAMEDQSVEVGVSVGIAFASDRCSDADDVLTMADFALYVAKEKGGNTYEFFDRELRDHAKAQKTLEKELKHACAANQLEMRYQPIVDLKSRKVAGFEALVRWRHPTKGLLQPSEFLALAERTGLIRDIGNWVINAAFREAAKWPEPCFVAINISPQQLETVGLLETITSALSEAKLSASRVHVEVTETALLNNNETTKAFLHELRRLGMHVALDDFGTGYSSLNYLASFPFDVIKIDRSFVTELSEHSVSHSIVQAVVQLSSSLNCSTIAEGIESEEHAEMLRCCVDVGLFLVRDFFSADPSQLTNLQQSLLTERLDGLVPVH